MNEIASNEILMLQSMFSSSFKQIDEKSVQFSFNSQFYAHTEFLITIAFSDNYPREPLERIELQTESLTESMIIQIKAQVLQFENYLLNEVQGYIYELVSQIDNELENDRFANINEGVVEEDEDVDKEITNLINHGQLPGHPVTKAAYNAWFADYIKKNNIELMQFTDWTNTDPNEPLGPNPTGYEIFKKARAPVAE